MMFTDVLEYGYRNSHIEVLLTCVGNDVLFPQP